MHRYWKDGDLDSKYTILMENWQIPPKYVCNHIWPFRNRIIGSEYWGTILKQKVLQILRVLADIKFPPPIFSLKEVRKRNNFCWQTWQVVNDNTHILDGEGQELHAHPAQVRARHLFYHHCELVHFPITWSILLFHHGIHYDRSGLLCCSRIQWTFSFSWDIYFFPVK